MILYKVVIECNSTDINNIRYYETDHCAMFVSYDMAFKCYDKLKNTVNDEYTSDAVYSNCSDFIISIYKGEQKENYNSDFELPYDDEFYWTRIESESIMNPLYREG